MKRMFPTALSLAVSGVLAASLCAYGQAEKKGTAYLVSNAHLDTQWNWTVRNTISEYLPATARQNLFLLDSYPDYVFNFEGAQRYAWIKEYYPELFARVKEHVAKGRWHLTGSSWDANETVICSPESFLRNITLGQTWFRNEFGAEGTDVFLPDCFGFTYDLPTLAAHCGLIGFSSQKLAWRINPFYEDGTHRQRVPFNVGVWQGIDGSRIMFAHGSGYSTKWKETSDLTNSGGLRRMIGESKGVGAVYHYYGVGDKGGSPTIGSVVAVQRAVHSDGKVKVVSAASDRMYKDFQPLSAHPELPVYDGELLMDAHGNACYTSQAAMKLYNRQNEVLGDATERASCAAEWLGAARYPSSTMTESWKRMIWHQFHDDLTGTSIPEAYSISWNDELLSLRQFSQVLTDAVSGIASQMDTRVNGTPVVVYDSRAAASAGIADILLGDDESPAAVYDPSGRKVLSQTVERRDGRHLLFETRSDGAGLTVYGMRGKRHDRHGVTEKAVKSFGNSVYEISFDDNGDICSLIDRRKGKELVAPGQAIGLVMFEKCRSEVWPAWEITYKAISEEPVKIVDDVETVLVEDGPLCKTVRVSKRHGESRMTQYVTLYEGACADRIDFRCEVDWKSADALLKADFPLSVSNPYATYDIGLGSVSRDNNVANKYEVYAHEWADLSDTDGSYGVTVMNFCKYGWDKPADNRMRLSLLYSPSTNELTYPYQTYQDFGWHTFTYSLRGHEGGLDKAEASKLADSFNNPPMAFRSGRHGGPLGRKHVFLSSDNDAVMVSALKKAENSDRYVVRVFETTGESDRRAKLTFSSPISGAWTADGTERETGETGFSGRTLDVEINPFGVRTYLLSFDAPECGAAEYAELDLPYDRRCFSFNGMRTAADFRASYSYAAELIPDGGIDMGGVHFRLGDKHGPNGLVCKGDTIAIPQGYDKFYLLAAATDGDVETVLKVNGKDCAVNVPYYTGNIGQWEHYGQSDGYLKDANVAYVGTHRHSMYGDDPYVFTYMFRIGVDVPREGGYVVLPEQNEVVVFAASVAREGSRVTPAGRLFVSGNRSDVAKVRENLLENAAVTGTSGIDIGTKGGEIPAEENMATEWNDPDSTPHWIEFDLGGNKTVSGWKLVSAPDEKRRFMVRDCMLEGRADGESEWKTIDMVGDNVERILERRIRPAEFRHIRLRVITPRYSIYCRRLLISDIQVY